LLYITESASSKRSKGNKAMETTYITPAETAKLIRAELKATFTGVKFSVRKEHFAVWVTIPATASVTVADVEAITKNYEGSTFDGSIDLASNQIHLVDGKKIQYLADYVFVQKDQVA
jgi:hypothetical protein